MPSFARPSRATNLKAGSVIDFHRLRKYGVAAVLVLAVYGAMCLAFPGVSRHAGRVLIPWHIAKDDMPQVPLMKRPIEFTLATGNAAILRGGGIDLEAVLSRPSEDPVVLNFRIAGDAKANWRTIAMSEAPKLNGYNVNLPDVNDETEYFVSSGPYRSDKHKISVYDKLAINGVELTTKYPAYLGVPDRVETVSSGDIAVPIGSQMRVRVLTNRPLATGQLTWQDGSRQPMKIDGNGKSVSASFEVKADASYNFAISDVMKQKAEGASVSTVRALVDNPPTMEIKFPTGPVIAHPLGEVDFDVEAIDDFGLASVAIIYERIQSSEPSPRRIVMQLRRGASAAVFPDVCRATLRFALDELQPKVMPQEVINYYIECTDRKGQRTVSDYNSIVVGSFEAWPTIDASNPHEPHYGVMKDVRDYVAACWKLEQDKPTTPKEEFARRCLELAESMINPDTQAMFPFYVAKKVPPEKRAVLDEHLAAAHKELLASDAASAGKDFRIVLNELTLLGLLRNGVLIFQPDGGFPRGTRLAGEKNPSELLQAITVEVAKVQPPPGYKPPLAQEAEKLRKTAADLKKQQEEIARRADEMAKADADPAKKDADQTQKDAKDLGAKQDELADKTRKEAEKAKDAANDKKTGEKTDPEVKDVASRIEDASHAMKDAARNMTDNRMEQAAADAKRAVQELQRAADKLDTVRQEKLAAAIAQAEAQAGKALKEQKELGKDTEAMKDPANANDAKKDKQFERLAVRQAQLQVNVKELMKDVDDLHKLAQREAKPETAKHVQDGANHLKRGEADQKMANAVVELAGKRADAAAQEQQAAQNSLEGAVVALRKASDSLAADRESELKRAANEARKIEQDLRKLGAEPKQLAAGPTSRPAVAMKDPAKDDPTAKGPQTQPAKTDPSKTDDANKNATARNDDKNAPAKPLSDREKKELKEDLSYDMERFAQHLENRDFASREEIGEIRKAAASPRPFSTERPDDKRNLDEIGTVVRRVRDKLEAEYQATLENKKLMAAQREECPPNYRQLVNKYYEALANEAKR